MNGARQSARPEFPRRTGGSTPYPTARQLRQGQPASAGRCSAHDAKERAWPKMAESSSCKGTVT
jgi:hypothetical protein